MRNGNPQSRAAAETISRGGFRMTKQRQEVYDALLRKRDHPTAMEVFLRVKDRLPAISLATVYNCLETLTRCGLVRQVSLDRAAVRYCPNLHRHGHFFCDSCGTVIDVEEPAGEEGTAHYRLPERCVVTQHEFTLRGLCPRCSGGAARSRVSASASRAFST